MHSARSPPTIGLTVWRKILPGVNLQKHQLFQYKGTCLENVRTMEFLALPRQRVIMTYLQVQPTTNTSGAVPTDKKRGNFVGPASIL